MDLKEFIRDAITATSVTVASTKITINAPAVPGLRVYLLWACFTTDLVGIFDCLGGAAGATSKLPVRTQVAATTFVNPAVAPPWPIPVGDVGITVNFYVDVTTTGRLTVVYGYGK